MAKPKILLADPDAKSRQVLEISLKKSGFIVTTADTGVNAYEIVESYSPDLIISEIDLGDGQNGFTFCENVKNNPKFKSLPFIFLTKRTNVGDKIRGLELGVEDYLTKPIYLKEIVARVKMLLDKLEKNKGDVETQQDNTTLAGDLSNLGVVDLMQMMEYGSKTAIITIRQGSREGKIFFVGGNAIHAVLDNLVGERAIYRMLQIMEGKFTTDFPKNINVQQTIKVSNQGLLMEGMRRIDELERIKEQLPTFDTVLVIDSKIILEEHPDRFPAKIENILADFDGKSAIEQIVERLPYDDLETLEVVSKLYFQGFLTEAPKAPPAKPAAPAPVSPAKPDTRGAMRGAGGVIDLDSTDLGDKRDIEAIKSRGLGSTAEESGEVTASRFASLDDDEDIPSAPHATPPPPTAATTKVEVKPASNKKSEKKKSRKAAKDVKAETETPDFDGSITIELAPPEPEAVADVMAPPVADESPDILHPPTPQEDEPVKAVAAAPKPSAQKASTPPALPSESEPKRETEKPAVSSKADSSSKSESPKNPESASGAESSTGSEPAAKRPGQQVKETGASPDSPARIGKIGVHRRPAGPGDSRPAKPVRIASSPTSPMAEAASALAYKVDPNLFEDAPQTTTSAPLPSAKPTETKPSASAAPAQAASKSLPEASAEPVQTQRRPVAMWIGLAATVVVIAAAAGYFMLRSTLPTDPQALYEAAQIDFASNQSATALEKVRAALVKNPTFAEARWLEAKILGKSGDIEGALTAYRAAIFANPKMYLARYEYVELADRSGSSDADRLLRDLDGLSLELSADANRELYTSVQEMRVRLLLRGQRYTEARSALALLTKTDPTNPKVEVFTQELASLASATASTPEPEPEPQAPPTPAAVEPKTPTPKPAEAKVPPAPPAIAKPPVKKEIAKTAPQLAPDVLQKVQEFHAKGLALYRKGYLRSATRELEQALALAPKSDAVMVDLGRVLVELGQDRDALKIFLDAAKINPENAQIYVNLGSVYMLMGNNDAARKAYKMFLSLVPANSKEAKEVQSVLKSLGG